MSLRARIAIKLVFSAACLLALWHWVDVRDLTARFRNLTVLPLFAAMVMNFLHLFLNALKIRLLFPKPRPPLAGLMVVNLIAVFFRTFVPGGVGGEVARWAYLSRESGSKSRTLAVILLDRITGFWSQIILVLAAWIWLGRGSADSWKTVEVAVPTVLLVLGASLGAGLLGYRGLSLGVQKLGAWYARRTGQGEANPADIGMALADLLTSRARFLQVGALTMVSQLVVVVTFLLLDRSIGDSVNWAQAVVFLFCYTVIVMLPVTLGNWGVSEGAMGFLYHYAGSQSGIGVLISLLLRIMRLPAACLGWFFFLARRTPVLEES